MKILLESVLLQAESVKQKKECEMSCLENSLVLPEQTCYSWGIKVHPSNEYAICDVKFC